MDMGKATKRAQRHLHKDELEKRGARHEKREDRHGDTKTGWWMDDVYLAREPGDALRVLNGN